MTQPTQTRYTRCKQLRNGNQLNQHNQPNRPHRPKSKPILQLKMLNQPNPTYRLKKLNLDNRLNNPYRIKIYRRNRISRRSMWTTSRCYKKQPKMRYRHPIPSFTNRGHMIKIKPSIRYGKSYEPENGNEISGLSRTDSSTEENLVCPLQWLKP